MRSPLLHMQDGGIQYEVKLTGILSTNLVSPADGDDPEWGTLMLPGVTAGYHQHLFIARLDWAVDNQRSQDSGLVVSEVPLCCRTNIHLLSRQAWHSQQQFNGLQPVDQENVSFLLS